MIQIKQPKQYNKLFLAKWDSNLYETAGVPNRMVGEDFFIEEFGYTPETIEAVSKMKIQETITPDTGHSITRIK